ncbi:MAG: hypothetical protein HUN04_08750 [Desulfobacter sp.]|nr:MAG: hypothetical protein HUN04_08750 [Desulfobacter sp.]
MTTVPGHNQLLQQSVMTQELGQQSHSAKPSPGQAAAVQQAQEVVQNTTVQVSEESERLKEQKEKRKERLRAMKARKHRKQEREEELAMDPEAKGRLLDTRA